MALLPPWRFPSSAGQRAASATLTFAFSFSRKRRCRIRSFPSLIRARGGAIAAFASVGGFLDDFGVCFCLL